ncbi:MAG: PhoH family protein [Verrucomicrobiae bacterium]|nr:PhoH family protein [Verrucomicrobiae bacterium]
MSDPTPARAKGTAKNYVLDTNVLLHDPQSIFRFEDNAIWIPVEVLEELDRFKSENTTRGANAREVHRSLSGMFRTTRDMDRGVRMENGGTVRVPIRRPVSFDAGRWHLTAPTARTRRLMDLFPDLSSPDNRILVTAAHVADSFRPAAILVTKDLNMQLKAKAVGLQAQDYRTDRVEDSDIRRTQHEANREDYPVIDLPARSLQAFASQGFIDLSGTRKAPPEQYVLLRHNANPEQTIPARQGADRTFHRLRSDIIALRGGKAFRAVNLGQRFFLDALFDPEIHLVTVYGKAGTGKTLLSVGAALQQVQSGLYEKLLVTRVIMPTGRDIGFLPGRLEEKMQPWVQPVYDALEQLLSPPRSTPDHFDGRRQSKRKKRREALALAASGQSAAIGHGNGNGNGNGNAHFHAHGNGNGHFHGHGKTMRPYEPLLHNGTIEIEAICHIRGRSIPNAVFIVDEAQQLTPHEAKTLVTRMGKGSKLIMIGDLSQIDNPYVDAHTNGLVYTRSRLEGQPFMAHVNLFKGERSEMAEVAANLM